MRAKELLPDQRKASAASGTRRAISAATSSRVIRSVCPGRQSSCSSTAATRCCKPASPPEKSSNSPSRTSAASDETSALSASTKLSAGPATAIAEPQCPRISSAPKHCKPLPTSLCSAATERGDGRQDVVGDLDHPRIQLVGLLGQHEVHQLRVEIDVGGFEVALVQGAQPL